MKRFVVLLAVFFSWLPLRAGELCAPDDGCEITCCPDGYAPIWVGWVTGDGYACPVYECVFYAFWFVPGAPRLTTPGYTLAPNLSRPAVASRVEKRALPAGVGLLGNNRKPGANTPTSCGFDNFHGATPVSR